MGRLHEQILFLEPKTKKKLGETKKKQKTQKNNISGGPGFPEPARAPGPPEILFFFMFLFFLFFSSFFWFSGSTNRMCSWGSSMNRICSWGSSTNRICSWGGAMNRFYSWGQEPKKARKNQKKNNISGGPGFPEPARAPGPPEILFFFEFFVFFGFLEFFLVFRLHEQNLFVGKLHEQNLFVGKLHEQNLFMGRLHEQILFVGLHTTTRCLDTQLHTCRSLF